MLSAPPRNLNPNFGGVLFIILIAVALFAVLSYAVTTSTRSGSGDASKEQNQLLASQFLQYGSAIETAIQRMRISNGCNETQISFENPIVSGYTNANAPANYFCHVFRPEGGNVSIRSFNVGGTSFYPRFNANNCVIGIGTGSLYPCPLTGVDLIMHIQAIGSDASQFQGFCMALNKDIGGGIPNEAGITSGSVFTGSFLVGNTLADDIPALQGKNYGCFYEVEDSALHMYYALIGR